MPIENLIYTNILATHIYVSNDIYYFAGSKLVIEMLMPIMVPKNNLFNWDTEDKEKQERLIAFKLKSDNRLETNSLGYDKS
ncbi:hypothetical protein [Shimazuella kribbensis]|uniref:hypothetical protein n=1 Tax=Shimazuella kribbensis TaxID=139808 RepID=UPI000490608B|nr:hypothetical protein [Shimazuella kribbensis]